MKFWRDNESNVKFYYAKTEPHFYFLGQSYNLWIDKISLHEEINCCRNLDKKSIITDICYWSWNYLYERVYKLQMSLSLKPSYILEK